MLQYMAPFILLLICISHSVPFEEIIRKAWCFSPNSSQRNMLVLTDSLSMKWIKKPDTESAVFLATAQTMNQHLLLVCRCHTYFQPILKNKMLKNHSMWFPEFFFPHSIIKIQTSFIFLSVITYKILGCPTVLLQTHRRAKRYSTWWSEMQVNQKYMDQVYSCQIWKSERI